ncbi:MAG: ABC transporter permease, partial [Pyramidobacter sp.]|nr:ABC transporter permease [Pyramidobacter sp.]
GVGIPLGALSGYFYGLLLNKVKGQEMTVGTYMGFSIVSLMCIFWLVAPYSSPEMIWPYGGTGLRVTIVLDGRLEQILDKLMAFSIFGVTVPTGLLLVTVLVCIGLWIYQRTRSGLAMAVVGGNPRFAESSGLNVNKYRIISCMISNALGALGIIIYSQSFGFVQLYQAPLYMGLYCVSAILIGGASLHKATITQALIGTFLFQSLLVISVPVANVIFENNLSEVARVIVSNGIILYALTRKAPGGDSR